MRPEDVNSKDRIESVKILPVAPQGASWRCVSSSFTASTKSTRRPAALRHTWEDALLSAWNSAGLAKPHYTLEMPYYGNLLARSARARGLVQGVVSRSGIPELLTRIEQAMIHEIAKVNGIGDAQLSDAFARDVLRSDFAECESVQGIFRFLERDIPGFGSFLLSPRARSTPI